MTGRHNNMKLEHDMKAKQDPVTDTNQAGSWMAMGLRLILRSKLYWGLGFLLVFGAFSSPETSKGVNIFLSLGNMTDVLRQVSVTGIVAVGLTLVILIAGIDLSVGSILALGTVICAMLLTQAGWTAASYIGVPAVGAVVFICAWAVISVVRGIAQNPSSGRRLPTSQTTTALIALLCAAVSIGLMIWLAAQVPGKFGVLAVLITVPSVCALFGVLNGVLIVYGRLQPFIVTLAMMVGALGLARLIAGQDTAVYPVYTGTNATENFEALRTLLWDVIPVPGLFFLSVLAVFYALTRFTTFGAFLLAIGGNEQASRLAGINVNRTKITTYAISSALAGLAGILYVAQFRQGKPDAGMGLELDAIAAVVIGGTSLMGGRGTVIGTMVGVLIFGFLGNILQLNNIDSNSQLVLKGVIIIAAVLLQEGQLSVIFSKLRRN
jgi:simple sugar transport system permease protein